MRDMAVRPYAILLWTLLALVLALLPFRTASAQEFGERVLKEGHYLEDQYLAGEVVELRGIVEGDVVAAGGRVLIEERVTGDVIVAGGVVDLRAMVDDDVRAAGGQVLINGEVAGDLIAAGGEITVPTESAVGERAWLAGGELEIGGYVGRELRAAGEEVTISGEINGDALVYGKEVRVLPTARIAGRLVHYGPKEAEIAPAARILGGTEYHQVQIDARVGERVARGMATMLLLALLTTGIVLFLVFPHFSAAAVGALRVRPWASLGIGLAVFFTVPPVAMLLMMTAIGAVLAVVLLMLYGLLMLAGFLVGMLCTGDLVLRLVHKGTAFTRSWRLLSLAAVFLVLWLIGFVPPLAVLVAYIVMVLGAGALMVQFYRMYTAFREAEGEAAS